MSKKGPRARAWVFTLNNYSKDDEEYLQNVLDCSYIVYGREVSPSGTPHLQGYMYFDNPRSGSAIGKLRKWWTEPAKADSLSNGAYTKKGDDWYEKGTRPATQKEKGDRNADRYKRAYDSAMAGDYSSIDSDILVRHYATLKKLKAEMSTPVDLDYLPLCMFFYGDTGTGKSRLARELVGDTCYRKDSSSRWWTNYQHQDYVWIDEIETTDRAAQAMYKQLCDHYAFPVETKGGNLVIRPKVIIFTSNWTPAEVFREAYEPMKRRLTLYNFTLDNKDGTKARAIQDFRSYEALRLSSNCPKGSPPCGDDAEPSSSDPPCEEVC